jgi:hypothetical protein
VKKNTSHLNIEEIAKEYLGGSEMSDLVSKYKISASFLANRFKKLGVRKLTKHECNDKIFSSYKVLTKEDPRL